jgi:hypothetical protein
MAVAPPGWPTDADGVSYPPAPWHLRGTAWVSLWRVPADGLPAGCLPPGARPATVFGRALVATAWAVYGPGGTLAYDEVLAAVRVRVRGRSFTTVTHVWVDHPASVAGGRALWGIPKRRAVFQVQDGGARGAGFAASAATLDGRPIAALRFRGRTGLPGRWSFRTRTAQRPLGRDRGEDPKIARAEAVAAVELGVAAWDFAPDGPLGFLNGREAFLSARLADLALRFGG